MKKYLSITGFVALYLLIVYEFSDVIANLWFSGVLPKNFADRNYDLISLIGFLLVLMAYALILKLRKKSLIKICNFSKLSAKNFISIAIIGALMGGFTCCFCNIGFIHKNTIFEQYLNYQANGSRYFVTFLIIIAITFAFEEMIFRGTIFNEIRNGGVSLYKAIIISTAIYGILNGVTMGYAIGTYAFVAALFYTLAYVYMGSLFASITLQIASIYVIYIFMKMGIWQWLGSLGDVALAIFTIVIMAVIGIFYYFMFNSYKKSSAGKQTSISV